MNHRSQTYGVVVDEKAGCLLHDLVQRLKNARVAYPSSSLTVDVAADT